MRDRRSGFEQRMATFNFALSDVETREDRVGFRLVMQLSKARTNALNDTGGQRAQAAEISSYVYISRFADCLERRGESN